RPPRMQLGPQRMFVPQHPDNLWPRMLGPRDHHEQRSRRRGRVGWVALAAQDALTVLDDRLKGLLGKVRGPSVHVRCPSCSTQDLRATPFIGPFELTEYFGLALVWGALAVTAPFRAVGRPV